MCVEGEGFWRVPICAYLLTFSERQQASDFILKGAHMFYWILVLNYLIFSVHVICVSNQFFFLIVVSFFKITLTFGILY